MPINFTSISGGTGGAASSQTDGDSTTVPGSNSLVVVMVLQLNFTATTPPQPTAAGKGIASFDVVQSQDYVFSGVGARLTMLRGMTASPAAAAIVIDAGVSVDFWAWEIVQSPDVDTSGTNGSGAIVQSDENTGNSSTASAALASFADATNNATLYAVSHGQSGMAINPEAGMTAFTQRDVLRAAWRLGEDTSPSAAIPDGPFDWAAIAVEVKADGGAATPELRQEGARFRNDDGSESAATWAASQDANITHPLSTNLRLRALLDAIGDVASAQFRLDYKKSTDSVYRPVLVSQPSTVLPTYKGSGTFTSGSGAITPPMPTGGAAPAADDILLLVVESENQAISLTTANGFVQIPNSPQSAGTAATNPASRLAVYWKRAVGGDAAPVVADPGDHATAQIHCFSGCKTTGDPWNVIGAGNDGGANDTTGVIPGATTTVPNCLVVLLCSTSNNATSTTNFSGWTNADLAALTERTDNSNTIGLGGGHGMATGEKATAGTYGNTTVTLGATSFKGAFSIALEPPAVTQEAILLGASTHIAAGGAATTAQLTPPAGKATSDFVVGRIQDDENPADAIDITADDYTELEWSLVAISGVAANGDIYQFRITVAGVALDGYDVTPEWTIGAGGGGALVRIVNEGLGVSDATLRALGILRLQAEALGLVEGRISVAGRVRVVAEALGLTEARLSSIGRVKLVSESLGMTEGTIARRALVRLQNEALAILEVSGTGLEIILIYSETMGLTEAVNRVLSSAQALVRIRNEGIALTESALRVAAFIRVQAEALALTEAPVRGMAMIRARAEAIGLTETPQRIAGILRAHSEALSLTETTARLTGLIRSRAETLGLTDAIARFLTFTRIQDETLTIAESVVRPGAFIRIVTESLTIGEAILRVGGAVLLIVVHEANRLVDEFRRRIILDYPRDREESTDV